MSDRTTLAVGATKRSVPRILKRAVQVVVAAALTTGVLLILIAGNGLLLGRGGIVQGFGVWLTLIGRGDVLPMIVLTAIVTVAYLSWERSRENGR